MSKFEHSSERERTSLLRTARKLIRAGLNDIRYLRPRDLPLHSFEPASATVLFMVAVLISAATGVVRQVLFNAQFGTGPEASAYVAAFRLPETLINLIGGGALSAAMLPVLLRTAHEDGPEAERVLANRVLTAMIVVLVPSVIISMALTPQFVREVLAPGFDAPTQDLTVTLARLMLLEPPLIIVSAVATAVLNSRNQFFLTALSIALHNITLLGGIFAAAVVPGIGVFGPTIGLILDGLLQLLLLWPGFRANGFRFRPIWHFRDRRLFEVVTLLVPYSLSVLVNYTGSIIDTSAASIAREAGSLPAIYNANLLIGLPLRLLGMAVSQSVFPRLAAHAAAKDWHRMRKLMWRGAAVGIGLAVPAAVAMAVFGRPMIQLLFERGRFDALSGDLTYAVLVAYVIGLPAYIGTEILTRGFVALYDTRTPLLTNVLQVLGRLAFLALLLEPLGAIAIPLAFAVTSIRETLILAGILWFKLQKKVSN